VHPPCSQVPTLAHQFSAKLAADMSSKTQTVSKQFVGEVKDLVAELQSTSPLFIRCIKPNMTQQPHTFNTVMVLEQVHAASSSHPISHFRSHSRLLVTVLEQLRCSGLFGAVKLMQESYPTRIPYAAAATTAAIATTATAATTAATTATATISPLAHASHDLSPRPVRRTVLVPRYESVTSMCEDALVAVYKAKLGAVTEQAALDLI
jgi:hypothetical protein